MIKLKETADFFGLKTEMIFPILFLDSFFEKIDKELVLTSGTDWIHSSEFSDHYKGYAIDVRTRHLTEVEQKNLLNAFKIKMNSDYKMILHDSHAHISYRPNGSKRKKIYKESLK